MRSALVLAPALALGLVGCATLIGASFDDAHLSDGSAAGGPVDPLSVPRLFAWFSADYGVAVVDGGTGVETWTSHVSGQHADRLGPVTAPALIANAQHGLPSVHFVASKGQMLRVNAKGLGGTGATFFVVGRGSEHAAITFRNDANATPFILFPYDLRAGTPEAGVSAALYIQGEAQARLPIRAASWGIWEARYAGGTASGIETFVNGVQVDKATPVLAALPDGLDMYLGGVPPAFSGLPVYFDGDLGEVLVYQAALPDSVRQGVEQYLSLRWDVPLGK